MKPLSRLTGPPALLVSITALASIAFARGVPAQEPPPTFPELTRWVSEDDDISALFVNPAGLAISRGAEGFLELNFERGEHTQGIAAVGLPFLKLGYVHDSVGRRDYDTYALGSGIDLAPLWFGWTTRWHRSDTMNGSKAVAHDAGALFRPLRYLSAGFRLKNLNEPAFAGDRLPRGYTGAISVRPYLLDPERLTATLQTDWHSTEDRVRYTLAGEYRVMNGLRVAAHYTTRIREGGLALAVDFPGQTFRADGVDRDGHGMSPHTGYALHSHSDFRHNAFPVVKGFAEVRITGRYTDQASGFVLAGEETKSGPRLIQVLKRARDDEDIAGAIVSIGNLGGAFIGDVSATTQEIRRALLDIRRAGKPVVAYLEEGGGAAEIYLASAADRIVMPRLGGFQGIGVAVEILRLKSALADFGIDWDAHPAGRYKSTFHTYYTDSTTAPQKEEVEALVQAAYADLESTLVAARSLSPAARDRIFSGGVITSREAQEMKLIDQVGWFEDARRAASALAGGGTDPARLKTLEARRYWRERWTPPPAVAVILAEGDIVSGESRVNRLLGGRTMGSETVARAIRAAAANPTVKALVLRVDSGGGSALASDRIREELIQARQHRHLPIIISMGDVAASGGYWISMDGDRIVADPLTVTGSIGVVNMKPVLARLLEKRDVNREVFKRGEHTDMFSPTRPMTAEELRQVGAEVDTIYREFVDGVAKGRNLSRAQAESVAQGRVWLGSQARQNGLADSLGTLDDAVRIAAEAAGIASDHRVLWYTGMRTSLLSRLTQGVEYVGLKSIGVASGGDPGAPDLEAP